PPPQTNIRPGSPSIQKREAEKPVPSTLHPIKKRSRLFYLVLGLLIVLLVGLIGTGAYFVLQPPSNASINQLIQQARGLITQAQREVTSNPALALEHL